MCFKLPSTIFNESRWDRNIYVVILMPNNNCSSYTRTLKSKKNGQISNYIYIIGRCISDN